MRVAVVDGLSSGRELTRELIAQGAECVHVLSSPTLSTYYLSTFQPADYVVDLGYDEDRTVTAQRLLALGVEHIVAGTESGVRVADELNHLTGLPGNDYALSGARHHKHRMAAALQAAGVDAPRSGTATSVAGAVAWYRGSGLADVVVKPAASATTDRVRVCRNAEEVERAAAGIVGTPNVFGQLDDEVVVQEFLAGREFSVNTITVNGVHQIVESWVYTKTRTADGAPIFDFEEPADLNAPDTHAVHEYVGRALTALGIRTGAGHSEIMLTDRGPLLIDPGARLGGGVLPWVATKFIGHSHAALAATSILEPQQVLRLTGEIPRPWTSPIRYVSLINRADGVVKSLGWLRRLESLPTALAVTTRLEPGDPLPRTTDLISSPGYIYLSAQTPEELRTDYETIRRWEDDGLYAS
ncbi:ATP-grasp domain-containing protein [Kribbella antibiotica]|uniref:ATP-grasp domain-containing protein n=1 Tax=Kribbella antibiotica TaxID=190195 RepID=A0A4R4ZVZ5_9ACTN|nr:ATP-grasp domain-containing protein [Kribbella antibiotica]TDD62700.1 ATP-grasp domain-containing protein [Kribbella antibiotica]